MACTYKKPQVDLIQNIYNLIKDRKNHTCLLHVHYVLSNKLRVLILTEAISRKRRPSERDSESNSYQHYEHYYTTYYHYHKVNAWSATVRRIYLRISSNPHRILLQKKTQPGFIPTDQVLKADGVQTTDLCENINQNTAILMAGHKHFYSEFQPKSCCDAKVWTQSMCLKLHLSWMLVCFGICLIATCPSNNASQSPYCIHQSTAKSECFPLFSPCCWKIHGQPAVGLNQRWRCSASPGFGSTAAQVPSMHDASLGPRTVPNCPAPIIRMFVYLHETWWNAKNNIIQSLKIPSLSTFLHLDSKTSDLHTGHIHRCIADSTRSFNNRNSPTRPIWST